MMTTLKAAIAGLALLSLAACGKTFLSDPFDADDPQSYAGINYAYVEFDVETAPDGTPVIYPAEVEVYGGKDNDLVLVEFEMPSGLKAAYRAEGSSGVSQVQARAILEAELSTAQKEAIAGIFPDGIAGLVRALADSGVVSP